MIGNDHNEDSDKEPEPPPKVVDKPVARAGKRNAPDTAAGQSRGGYSGNDEGTLTFHRFSPSNPFPLEPESQSSISAMKDQLPMVVQLVT